MDAHGRGPVDLARIVKQWAIMFVFCEASDMFDDGDDDDDGEEKGEEEEEAEEEGHDGDEDE